MKKIYKGKYLKYYKPFIRGEISIGDIARIEKVSYSTVSKAMGKCRRALRATQDVILSNINSSKGSGSDCDSCLLNTNNIDHVLRCSSSDEDVDVLSSITTSTALKKLASVDTLKVEINRLISNLFFDEKYREVVIKEQVYNVLCADLARVEQALRNAYHSVEDRSKLLVEKEQLCEEIERYRLTFRETILLKRLAIEKQYYTSTLNDKEFKQIVKNYLYSDNL
ncbi:hypothetical protein DB313_05680 (plasmid) [Borrelia turcica IST7]|uniref:Uncharacterized protein n=1 Tax=Borrelia turcica IST7 TaxID=1104446 RepID=A0A386PQ20_9SPIR|nr:hypothetical protein [Borrelia turcica]AYE36989.1 hypothetical protein DB313_05680 [Borrelia turcica IST7]